MTTTRLTRYDRSMLRLMNDRRAAAWYATAARWPSPPMSPSPWPSAV
ncbi:hypothetical protein ACFWJ5_12260 [Streptomyces qaidamensis]